VQEFNPDQLLESHLKVKQITKQRENNLVKFYYLILLSRNNILIFICKARKLTRSSSARIRKSKHVIGKVSDSDSEPEVPVSNKSSSATGKRKPATAKGKSSAIGNRKLTPKEISSYSGSAPSSQESCNTPSVEEKKCPMAGCDSSGNVFETGEKKKLILNVNFH
jgi:hypothetical protein